MAARGNKIRELDSEPRCPIRVRTCRSSFPTQSRSGYLDLPIARKNNSHGSDVDLEDLTSTLGPAVRQSLSVWLPCTGHRQLSYFPGSPTPILLTIQPHLRLTLTLTRPLLSIQQIVHNAINILPHLHPPPDPLFGHSNRRGARNTQTELRAQICQTRPLDRRWIFSSFERILHALGLHTKHLSVRPLHPDPIRE